MIKINNETKEIILIKGDTGSFKINVDNIPFINGYTVHFGIKKTLLDTTYLIHKTITSFIDGKAEITINPSDQVSLPIGEYIYGIRLIRTETLKDTLTPEGYAKFTVKGGVINE